MLSGSSRAAAEDEIRAVCDRAEAVRLRAKMANDTQAAACLTRAQENIRLSHPCRNCRFRWPRFLDYANRQTLGLKGFQVRSFITEVFDASAFRLYTPALFLARCAATSVAHPAQNLIRTNSLVILNAWR